MVVEREIKQLRKEFNEKLNDLRKLIMGRQIAGNWVDADTACMMMGVKKRRLADLRVHLNKNNERVGCISWRKSQGRNIQYYKPDIEKYLNHLTIS